MMKTLFFFSALLFITTNLLAQERSGLEEYNSFWQKTDSEFRNEETSPLPKDEIQSFDSVPRYPYQENYRVVAEWLPVKKNKPFYFNTTGDVKDKYRKIGVARFEINGKVCELSVYKNLELSKLKIYKDYLFIPFTDNSNGVETYGGGRYLSLHAEPEETLILDFNQSYNPYCAYSHKYSCPIPPRENFLDVSIDAGARISKGK